MKNKNLFEEVETIEKLGEKLSRLANVKRYDEKENEEGYAIAYSFSGLEESFRRFLDDHLPKLTKENITDSELEDILHDIGEEFRHILYHIEDMKYYKYLISDKDSK